MKGSPNALRAHLWFWPLVFLALWAVLLRFQAPSIVSGDSGETVAAALHLGVSHPPGHPLGELLGHLLTFLPLGTAAFRVNLLSALAALLAATLLGAHLRRRLDGIDGVSGWWGYALSALASVTLVLNPPVLEQILSAKGSVYTLSLLWSVCLLRSLRFEGERTDQDLIKIFFWLGLGLATHWPIALAGSTLVAVYVWNAKDWSARGWAFSGLGMTVGLSAYLLLPVRASSFPSLDWGHPTTLGTFWWVVSRANYSEMESAGRTMGAIFRQVGFLGGTLLTAFPWAILSLVGLASLRRVSNRAFLTTSVALALPALAVAVVPTLSPDTYFLIPTYLSAFQGWWVWTATLGLLGAARWALRKGPFLVTLSLLVFLPLLGLFVVRVLPLDMSRHRLSHDLGVDVLQALPKDAILLAEGDTYVLSMVHAREVEGLRRDVVVVPTVFLNGAWGFDQAARAIQPKKRPLYPPSSFEERVGFLASLGAPVSGEPEREVFVSSGNGAFLKANLGSYLRLEPWGLSYRLSSKDAEDPWKVRERVWSFAQTQRHRGFERVRRDVAVDPRLRELYGYYANAFILSGNALQGIGRYLEASDDYAKALGILPDSAEALSNMAAVSGASGLHELAQTFCRMALASDPDYAGAWDNLGNVYSLQGNWDDALDAYDRALAAKPDSASTKTNRERAEQGRREGRVGTVSRNDVKWYMDLAVSYYQQGRWVMANAVFETVRESGMDTAAVCGNLGVLRAQLGDIEGARKAFKDSLSRDPKFVETYKNAALLEIKMGREGEAKALLMKGREIQPENPEINALLTSLDEPSPR